MVFIDANVPIYLVGADHPNRWAARRTIERLAMERTRLVTSAEVFQELLHRYVAIDRRDVIQPIFDVLHDLVDEVAPVEEHDVFAAKDLVATHPTLSARDSLHVAVMRRLRCERIVTFDRGFDAVANLTRLPTG